MEAAQGEKEKMSQMAKERQMLSGALLQRETDAGSREVQVH